MVAALFNKVVVISGVWIYVPSMCQHRHADAKKVRPEAGMKIQEKIRFVLERRSGGEEWRNGRKETSLPRLRCQKYLSPSI